MHPKPTTFQTAPITEGKAGNSQQTREGDSFGLWSSAFGMPCIAGLWARVRKIRFGI